MKYLEKNVENCIKCGACETTCSKTYFKEENPKKSRVQVEKEDTPKIAVCNQCGKCIDICPEKAITRNKLGVVMISKADCVGCLNCVAFCPEDALFWYEGEPQPFKCISCGKCAEKCPTEAIFIKEVK